MVQHLIHIGSKTILPTGQTIQGESLPVTIASDQHEFPVQVADLPLTHVDAFHRLRVSNPETIFDSKQVYDQQLLYYLHHLENSATQTYHQERASTILAVNNPGDVAIRQSLRYFNYQPAKSQLLHLTFRFGAANPGVVQRVGIFDGYNGIFLEQTENDVAIVLRSNVSGTVVDERVLQADWNLNPLNGTIPTDSEAADIDDVMTLDLTKCQLMMIDYQWLGTGNVRIAFGSPTGMIYAHDFGNANSRESVYMATPNLPHRYEISTTDAPGTLECICGSCSSEGGQNQVGAVLSASRGITTISVANTGLYPIVSIRLKAGHTRRTVIPINFTVFPTTKLNIYWVLLKNPTRGTGTAASWTSVNAHSSIEYDITSTQLMTNGIPIVSGYIAAGTVINFNDIPDQTNLGAQDIDGLIPDELVLCAQAVTSTETVLGSIAWVEL